MAASSLSGCICVFTRADRCSSRRLFTQSKQRPFVGFHGSHCIEKQCSRHRELIVRVASSPQAAFETAEAQNGHLNISKAGKKASKLFSNTDQVSDNETQAKVKRRGRRRPVVYPLTNDANEVSLSNDGPRTTEDEQLLSMLQVRTVINAENSSIEANHGPVVQIGSPTSSQQVHTDGESTGGKDFNGALRQANGGVKVKTQRRSRKGASMDLPGMDLTHSMGMQAEFGDFTINVSSGKDEAVNIEREGDHMSLFGEKAPSLDAMAETQLSSFQSGQTKSRKKPKRRKKAKMGQSDTINGSSDLANSIDLDGLAISHLGEGEGEKHLAGELKLENEHTILNKRAGSKEPTTDVLPGTCIELSKEEEREKMDANSVSRAHSERSQPRQVKALKGSRTSKGQRKQRSEADANPFKVQGELDVDHTKAESVEPTLIEIAKAEQKLDLCTVKWLVEAHLMPNQQLFVVGAPPGLGAWDPSMALSFVPCEDAQQEHMWQIQTQVPFGTDFEYNYFIRVHEEGQWHLVWRPGFRLHLVIPPLYEMKRKKLIVKDSLDFNVENKLPSLRWEHLHKEIGFPSELKRFLGNEFIVKEYSEQSTTLVVDYSEQNISVEDEKLQASNLSREHAKSISSEIAADELEVDGASGLNEQASLSEMEDLNRLTTRMRRFIRKKVFPREEPWLMESMVLNERGEQSKRSVHQHNDDDHKTEDNNLLLSKKEESHTQKSKKVEVSTEILINSSKCTMERIAILEDGKLVELLLKPVNSDINIGNVYLGVVKKLLPGMTGVFVDIGYSRVALLSITKNMYPFTFPPIRVAKSSKLQADHAVNDVDGHSVDQQEDLLAEKQVMEGDSVLDDDMQINWEVEDQDGEEDEMAFFDELEGSVNRPNTVNFGQRFTKWRKLEEGMRIIVQVKREPLGKKGPKVCAFPQLAGRFWILGVRGKTTGVSKKIQGPERKRLKDLANLLRKPGYELTVRTEAAGQTQEDLEKDLARLLDTWKDIREQAEAVSNAVENGQEGAVPALLHRAMGQSLSIVRDFFAEKVHRMVVDSAQTYNEVITYLQEVAPQLLNRVDLYTGTVPIFDAFNLEEEIDKILNERVQLPNGAYLVIEETEALVSIDVNGGAGMLGKNIKSAAILEVNLAAARQIAIELRLRDIGGIIVIDFIDMDEAEHETLVYEEMSKAIESDRSVIHISEISERGLMEVTRRRVRPSVSFMISDPCSCCHGTGRVEALESTLSKIERAILRLVANHSENIHFDGRTWQRVLVRVDPVMFEFLTRKQRIAQLSSSLKVYISLKIGREMPRGCFEVSQLDLGSDKHVPTEGPKRSFARKGLQHSSVTKKAALRT